MPRHRHRQNRRAVSPDFRGAVAQPVSFSAAVTGAAEITVEALRPLTGPSANLTFRGFVIGGSIEFIDLTAPFTPGAPLILDTTPIPAADFWLLWPLTLGIWRSDSCGDLDRVPISLIL